MPAEGPTYLLRFDDICPTMDWRVWDRIETILLALEIRPILAVVPDNQDPTLVRGPAVCDFWERVRQWQARNWAIALHGYQHLYVNSNGGILKLGRKSEFAGLSKHQQETKLRAGLAKFESEGIRADAWIAPGHSFDQTTVQVLQKLGLRVISDGFSLFPFDRPTGVTWVPQQLWQLRPRNQGVWTVCYHPNEWSETMCQRFPIQAAAFVDRIGALDQVVNRWRGRTFDVPDHLNRFMVKMELGSRTLMGNFLCALARARARKL